MKETLSFTESVCGSIDGSCLYGYATIGCLWPCGLTCFHGRVRAAGGRGEFDLLLDALEKPKIPWGDRRVRTEAEGLKTQFEGDLISGSGFGGVWGIWYDTAVPASRKSWKARLISISLGERERRSRSLTTLMRVIYAGKLDAANF